MKPGFQRAWGAQGLVRTRRVTHSHGYTDGLPCASSRGRTGTGSRLPQQGNTPLPAHVLQPIHTPAKPGLCRFLNRLSLPSRSKAWLKKSLSRARLCLESCCDLLGGLPSQDPGYTLRPDPSRPVQAKSWRTKEMTYRSEAFRRTVLPC